jgi:hypothetical protein
MLSMADALQFRASFIATGDSVRLETADSDLVSHPQQMDNYDSADLSFLRRLLLTLLGEFVSLFLSPFDCYCLCFRLCLFLLCCKPLDHLEQQRYLEQQGESVSLVCGQY